MFFFLPFNFIKLCNIAHWRLESPTAFIDMIGMISGLRCQSKDYGLHRAILDKKYHVILSELVNRTSDISWSKQCLFFKLFLNKKI